MDNANNNTIIWKLIRKPMFIYCELVVITWSDFQ